jgi:hypothetical protein
MGVKDAKRSHELCLQWLIKIKKTISHDSLYQGKNLKTVLPEYTKQCCPLEWQIKCFDDSKVEPSEFTNNVFVVLVLNSLHFSEKKGKDLWYKIPAPTSWTHLQCAVLYADHEMFLFQLQWVMTKVNFVNTNLTQYHTYKRVKVNQSRYMPGVAQRVPGSCFPHFLTTAQDGGKVVNPTHRPRLPPGNSPGTHFC